MTFSFHFADEESSGTLPKHIDDTINADKAFLAHCGEYTNDIVHFMHNVSPYKIASTMKGGSLGKGTAVKDKSDLDILFVVNDFKSVGELQKTLKQMKHELHNALCCGSFSNINAPLTPDEKAKRKEIKKNRPFKVSDIRRTPYAVSFTMTHPDGTSMPVDLLLLAKVSKENGKFTQDELTNIYKEIRDKPEQREFYGKCLSPVQVEFVENQPEKIKGLFD